MKKETRHIDMYILVYGMWDVAICRAGFVGEDPHSTSSGRATLATLATLECGACSLKDYN